MRAVLLLLQSEGFCFATQEALREHYDIIVAQDAESGAALLRERPNILVLDLFLSGSDGFSFLKRNRHLLPPKVLLFTTLANSQILQTASDLEVDALFIKPCSISAVLKQLE